MDSHKDDINTCLKIGTIGVWVALIGYGGLLFGAWWFLR